LDYFIKPTTVKPTTMEDEFETKKKTNFTKGQNIRPKLT
jgi:hypothetical protein